MKFLIFLFVLMAATLSFQSCNDYEEKTVEDVPQDQGPSPEEKALQQFRGQLNELVTHYFSVKDGLVKNLDDATKERLEDMLEHLNATSAVSLAAPDQQEWQALQDSIRYGITQMQSAIEIEEMREGFRVLSRHIYMAAVKFRPNNETLYWFYCDQSNGGKSGAWLAQHKLIQNPYTGERSSKCGDIVEEVKPLK